MKEAKRLIAEYLKETGQSSVPEFELPITQVKVTKVAEAIQAMWKKELGVDVVLDNQEWKVFLSP